MEVDVLILEPYHSKAAGPAAVATIKSARGAAVTTVVGELND